MQCHVEPAIVAEKTRRMVEAGQDVLLLVDSLTALTRAYNTEVPHSGKILSAGLDAVALQKPKRLFGAARKVEEGGSLTVVATVETETGSRMNEVIAEEFRGKANSEIRLSSELAELHVYPAFDIAHTATRREDNLLTPDELQKVRALRRELQPKGVVRGLEELMARLGATDDNAAFLAGL